MKLNKCIKKNCYKKKENIIEKNIKQKDKLIYYQIKKEMKLLFQALAYKNFGK